MAHELIPIVAIISVFGSGIVIAGLVVYAVVRSSRLRYEERLALIKSGKDLPPDWEKTVARPKGRAMFWGIILTGFGAGLQIIQGFDFFADMFRGRLFRYNDASDYFGGMIFLGIGLALMYYHRHYQKQNGNGADAVPGMRDAGVPARQVRENPNTGEGI